MPPNPIDSLAFLRIVAALSLVKIALFGGDGCEVVCVWESLLGDIEERECGGTSTTKAELCGMSSSISGGAGASLFGFSGDVIGCGAFRCGDCGVFGGMVGGAGDFGEADFIILEIRARSDVSLVEVGVVGADIVAGGGYGVVDVRGAFALVKVM